MPTVTIGLPVFNGENFISQALESFLKQTYEDFEVVVSDNCSNDGTELIVRAYAQRDQRIRYFRSERNMGATWNFNRVLELAEGKYFRWAAHDDTIEPEYLELCVGVLDAKPEVVLCQTGVQIIDGNGEIQPEFIRTSIPFGSPRAHVRFAGFVLGAERCYEVFGLMRRDSLQRIPPLGDYGHADGVMLSRLSLLGPFAEIPERLQNMRVHDEQSMYLYGCYTGHAIDYERWIEWYNPDRSGSKSFPHWRMLWEYARSPFATPGISLQTRVLSLSPIGKWIRFYLRPLARELLRRMPLVAAARARRPKSQVLRT